MSVNNWSCHLLILINWLKWSWYCKVETSLAISLAFNLDLKSETRFTAEDEIRYKKCVDNLSKHNPFCSAILHFWSAIKILISAKLPWMCTTKLQRNVRSLGTRLADGYTASKCPSRYPIMKRSLAASASEQPVKRRKVKHETYQKWVGQYDRECRAVTWLDCETVSQ